MKQYRKKISFLLALVLLVGMLSGCGTESEIEKCVRNLDEFNNYYYVIDVGITTNNYYSRTSSEMNYYPATGELLGELGYEATLQEPYTIDLYCVQEDGAYWNYMGIYKESGTTYQKKKLNAYNPMYNIGNAFLAAAEYGSSFEKGKREEMNGNICQQYLVTIPPKDAATVLNSFGAISDLQAMGANSEQLTQVLSEYGFTMEIWLDTEEHLPVRYRVDYSGILKETIRRMGFDPEMNEIITCEVVMNLYGQNLIEGAPKVPAKMKNEAVDMTVTQ